MFKYIDFASRTEEKRVKVIIQNKKINSFLFADTNIDFKYPVNATDFENMIKDLLREEYEFSDVKGFGNLNERDGGRDVEFIKLNILKNSFEAIKIIGQCKAYKRNITKKDVLDIRDLIEQFNANGFFLACTETINVTLHDYLNKLSAQGYYVEWWDKADVLYRLKQNPDILRKYKNLFSAKGEQNGIL